MDSPVTYLIGIATSCHGTYLFFSFRDHLLKKILCLHFQLTHHLFCFSRLVSIEYFVYIIHNRELYVISGSIKWKCIRKLRGKGGWVGNNGKNQYMVSGRWSVSCVHKQMIVLNLYGNKVINKGNHSKYILTTNMIIQTMHNNISNCFYAN